MIHFKDRASSPAQTPEQRLAELRGGMDRIAAEQYGRERGKFRRYFPDCTPECQRGSMRREDHAGLCRVLYGRMLAFFAAGLDFPERTLMAANRVGKTDGAAFEVTAHLTGLYPAWWQGVRFREPTSWWGAGDTMLSTRDVLQVAMLGAIDGLDTGTWTGMLPGHAITNVTRQSGSISKAVDEVWVRHVTGGTSVFGFKSYDQGRRKFQGTKKHGVWLDEEPPAEVYGEALLRTMRTGGDPTEVDGLVLCTFTPLEGLTPFLTEHLSGALLLDGAGQHLPAHTMLGTEALAL